MVVEKEIRKLAEEMYYTALLARGIAAIEDYEKNPGKYLANDELVEYLQKLIDEKRRPENGLEV